MERQNKKTLEDYKQSVDRLSAHTIVLPEEVDIQLKYLLLHVHALYCIFTVAQPIEMFLLRYKWSPSSVSPMLFDPVV